MSEVGRIIQHTENRFLNFFEFEAVRRDGGKFPYFVASRAKCIDALKAVTRQNKANAVFIYGVYGDQKDHVVLVRQYRYPIGDYIYEFPAGLVEYGESVATTAIREMYEETGLAFEPKESGVNSRPFFTTVGMTDESCGMVFGYCSGDPSNINQEASEEIQVVIADRDECRRILTEENVALSCAYMLMHFVASNGDPLGFLK